MRTLFVGGGLFDGHRHLPSAGQCGDGRSADGSALLVEGDRVIALLSGPVGRDLVRSRTVDRVVDLEGGLLAPGFIDAHVHAVQGGLERIRCDLSGASTREGYLAVVAEYAAAHPDLDWILGAGWEMSAFPGGTPVASDLDEVVAGRPVFLPNRDHHGAWVNSLALAMAGISAATPDPPDGRIERDVDGKPTGTLHEGAMELVARLLPVTTAQELRQGLLAGQSHLHECGVTGWQDAILGPYAGMEDPSQTYLNAARSGDLTGSVVGALWWDRTAGPEEIGPEEIGPEEIGPEEIGPEEIGPEQIAAQVDDLVARRTEYTQGRLRATSVKIMQDGVPENGTAAMLTPYLDRCGHVGENRGHSFLPAAQLCEVVLALHTQGFQVHVHAIGDRGVREALDAFAGTTGRVPRAGHCDPRHHLAHVQVVHPDDVARFAGLGVAANLQMAWACLDDQMIELNLPVLGPERSHWQYPFGDLDRAGTHLVAGSDWPVTTPDPLAAIHVGVNRMTYGATGREGEEPFLPEQAIALERAFAAYTSGSARINHRADAGVLRPGAVADLVVLDRDPFVGPVSEIGAARVRATWIDGELVAEPLP